MMAQMLAGRAELTVNDAPVLTGVSCGLSSAVAYWFSTARPALSASSRSTRSCSSPSWEVR